MATGTIKQVIPNYGVESDERSAYCKFPDGTMIEWGNIVIENNSYAKSRSFGNRFARLDSVIVSSKDENVTAFALKSTDNTVSFARRPVTDANSLSFLVIGRWKL